MLVKVTILGVLLWIVLFVETGLLSFVLNLDEGLTYNLANYAFIAVFTFLACAYFFIGQRPMNGFKEGFWFGLGLAFIVFILDAIILVPFFIYSYTKFFSGGFYGDYLVIILVAIVGSFFLKGEPNIEKDVKKGVEVKKSEEVKKAEETPKK